MFALREEEDGSVTLTELQPVTVGKFSDRAIAERVLALLSGGSEVSGVKVAPVENTREPMHDEPTDDDWLRAFLAVKNGDDMRTVAQLLGVEFGVFRGKYGAWMKTNKATKKSLSDKDECTICGREFTPSASSTGLCARCSHD